MTSRTRWLLILGLLVVLGLPSVASQDLDPSARHQELDWHGSDRTALHLVPPPSRELMVRRILLFDGRHRLVGAWIYDRWAGAETLRLLDDDSGWWIEVRTEFGIRSTEGEEYPQYFDRLEEWLKVGQGHEIEYRVRTSTGFSATRRLPAREDFIGLVRALARELEGEDDWTATRRSIPAAVLAAANGWRGLLLHESNVDLLMEFLAAIEDPKLDQDASRVSLSKTPLRRGSIPEPSTWRDLLTTFDHFDPENPFPEDLFEPADPP